MDEPHSAAASKQPGRIAHRSASSTAATPSLADPRSNTLLAALPPESLARLGARLEPVQLVLRDVLHEPLEPVRYAYFPLRGVVSLVSTQSGSPSVELATVGSEGVVGVAAFLADGAIPHRACVQVPGSALRLPAAALVAEAERDAALDGVLRRYVQLLLVQVAQSVACNRLHPVNERCARWLLMTHDRVDGAEQFPLTQEYLAQMLGVRRATVTVAAGMLQRAGLIRYTRGKITVVDRAGLEAASCECYGAVRSELERLFGGRPGERALDAAS